MTFENKTVIVTGGGTGIGKETAKRFFNEGANVVINGRREDVLKQTANEIDPTGQKVRIAVGDISLPDTAKKLVAVAVEAFGGIDILVNNTGKFNPTPFLDHTAEDLDSYLNTIVKGTFFPSQAVIPEMKKRGGGAIINTGSMWAIQAVEATPSSAYSAAMAGRHALTRNMAIEFAADGIRVNAVAPAVVETPIYNTFLTEEEVAEVLPGFNAFHPLGRNGAPKDIADAILFLASDSAAWITGVIMPLDGGVTARLR
ncbi:SDR family NAD(P)-dependent oxidoreductase [Paenibacillus sp. WLX2291]|uniref:SDR family NAD(P)-dependent oxidoreductase n=1 Tax=Paenibacillus sp. WLX2291 TaxID=3296934 RepID=UPI003984289A